MSSAVRDLAEAEFLGERDEQNNPLPSRPVPTETPFDTSGTIIMIFFNISHLFIALYNIFLISVIVIKAFISNKKMTINYYVSYLDVLRVLHI